jgi:hypothetical protein
MPVRIQDATADRGEVLKDNLPGVLVSGFIFNSEVQELQEFGICGMGSGIFDFDGCQFRA